MTTLAEVTKAAMELPFEEREELVAALSVGSFETDEETIQEALRRNKEIEDGVAKTVSHDEVMANLKKRFGW